MVRTPLRYFESVYANMHASNPKLRIAVNLTSENISINVTSTEEEKALLISQQSSKTMLFKDLLANKI